MLLNDEINLEEIKTPATIITFIGTTPNTGTTLAAISHSYHIAQHTMCKVVYLCLNLKSSKLHRYFGITELPISLDTLLPNLKNKQLADETFEKLLFQPSKKHEVYMLFGNQQRELAEQFMEDDLQYLIAMAQSKFDYVILDTSSYWDNAGTFAALQLADHIVITTTDARSNFQEDFQRWFGTISSHMRLELDRASLLLIRQSFSDQQYSFKDIVAETAITPYAQTYFPTTVLSYLDRGELLEWLLQVNEAKQWFTNSCHILLNPEHLSQLPSSYLPVTRMYWPWQKRLKETTITGG